MTQATIVSWGQIASAIAAIIGLVSLILIKPLRAAAKRRREAEDSRKAFQAEVLGKLDAVASDIGDLQYERLAQAYDFYMDRGWCPASKKEQLCQMHRSYAAKGRNHLTKHYEADLLALPEHPPEA